MKQTSGDSTDGVVRSTSKGAPFNTRSDRLDLLYANDPIAYEAEEWSRPDEMALFSVLWSSARRELDSRPDSWILDLCCGTGMSLLGVVSHPHMAKAIGVDVSGQLLQFAKSRYSAFDNVHFVCADAVKQIFPPSTFDLVLASSAYHHIEDERKHEFLDTCYLALKPSGRVLVAENVLPSYSNHDEAYDRSVRLLYAAVTAAALQEYPRLPPTLRDMIEENVSLSVDREYEFKADRSRLLDGIAGASFEVDSELAAWVVDSANPVGSGGNSLFVLKKRGMSNEP